MALATQCPHCQTTFRVANDQLKLRGGLVRCGSCREVFNGIEHLVRPDVAAPVPVPNVAPPSAEFAPAATEQTAPTPMHHIAVAPAAEAERVQETDAAIVVATDHPLQTTIRSESPAPAVMPAPAEKTSSSVSDRVEAAIDDLEEDLRIAEETSQSAPADVHHTPFGLVKPSAPAEDGEPANETPAPNVWHRHVDVDAGTEADVEADDSDDKQMARMTLMHVAGADDYTVDADGKVMPKDGATPSDDDELDRIIDELQRKPWRGEKNAAALSASDGSDGSSRKKSRDKKTEPATEHEPDASDEPDFVLSARRKQRIGGALRGAMWGVGALLLVGAIGQSVYLFRDQLAVRVPQIKPLLTGVCAKIGCSINLPMKIDTISMEANELQALDPARNIFSLNLLLRNRSDTVQAWPSIELTLNDANEKPIVRRIFAPRDYLSAATNASLGFGSDQEQPVKLTFELQQLKASGYRVYLFYP